MLHGLQSSLETFIPLIPKFQSHFNLLLVDQRGHGKSAPQGDDYTAEAMAHDLKALLDHLKIEKIILLGHSMGGRTALAFGYLFPSMIIKMILEDMGIEQRQIRTLEKDNEKQLLARNAFVSSLIFRSRTIYIKSFPHSTLMPKNCSTPKLSL